MIDVNVHLSRWPFRRLNGDEPGKLMSTLNREKVEQAWVCSFDAMLHRDMEGVNRRLVADCQAHGRGILIPFGCVNPTLPDWEEDLRRCKEVHRMPGVRLYPNYHQYSLEERAFVRLLELADARNLLVQIVVAMEDERTQHPLVRVPPVDVMPLTKILTKLPTLPVCVLNGLGVLNVDQCQQLVTAGNVHFDIAMLEGTGGIRRWLDRLPFQRLLFGSHFPFFYFQSATLKMLESEIAIPEQKAISRENAQRLLGISKP
ncbi:MAG: amidohydrolase family protein [Planctomycetota bacterium]